MDLVNIKKKNEQQSGCVKVWQHSNEIRKILTVKKVDQTLIFAFAQMIVKMCYFSPAKAQKKILVIGNYE